MEVRAVAKYVRVQPRKVRIVAREVKGKSAMRMADVLRFHPSKGARALQKVIVSAVSNAAENHGASPDSLRIKEIQVDEGPHIKRIMARAMGRANRILKKTSHITVVVEEAPAEERVRPHGTKAKARPKFEQPKGKKPAPAKKAKEEVAVTEAVETEEPTAEMVAEVEEATPAEVVEEEVQPEPAVEAAPEAEETADGGEAEEEKA